MTQEILSEDQKANLRMISAKYDTEYIKFKDGDERMLQFMGNAREGKSDKYGTDQVEYDVIDINQPFTSHKWSVSSKKAIHAVAEYLLRDEVKLHIKRIGDGTSTRWEINPI